MAELDLKNIKKLAEIISSDSCKNVVILTGAGMSTGAGIPDFRSPGGMYSTLKPELLTATEKQKKLMKMDPSYVVEKSMFFENPLPYHEVRRPFILGTFEHKWKATISHRFTELLDRHGKLSRLYTQNIDGLDYQCKTIDHSKILPVHGSIGKVICEGCGAVPDYKLYLEQVRTQIKDIYGIDPSAPKESTPIVCGKCKEPRVKPATVLFGSSLPSDFFDHKPKDLASADVVIVAGTSLVVSPANTIASDTKPETYRFIINKEKVGQHLGISYDEQRDFFISGECDPVFLQLAKFLGWDKELLEFYEDLPEKSKELLVPTNQQHQTTPGIPSVQDLFTLGSTLPIDTDHILTKSPQGPVVLIRLGPNANGAPFPFEIHENQENILCIQGKVTLEVETGDKFPLSPGQLCRIPANIKHKWSDCSQGLVMVHFG